MHIHFTPEDAKEFGVEDKQIVSVKIESEGRSLTFGDGGGCDWEKLLRFIIWNLISLSITTVLITVLTRAGMWAYLAKLFVTVEEGVVNYFAYKFLVFHVKSSDRRDRA